VSRQWPGGEVHRGLQARPGGGVRRPWAVWGREGDGCGRVACGGCGRVAEGRGRRAGVRDWGGREEWGMRLVLPSECWVGPEMNVGLKYFVG
jgi:hypothetical protein